MDIECWRAIPDFPGYEVSTMGNVRSWRSFHNGILDVPRTRKCCVSGGYRYVRFASGTQKRVARLMLLTWRPSGSGIARHLNGNRLDDRLVNLAWGTFEQNCADAKRHGTWAHGTRINTARLTEEDVRYVRQSDSSCRKLATKFNVNVLTIWRARTKHSWKHLD